MLRDEKYDYKDNQQSQHYRQDKDLHQDNKSKQEQSEEVGKTGIELKHGSKYESIQALSINDTINQQSQDLKIQENQINKNPLLNITEYKSIDQSEQSKAQQQQKIINPIHDQSKYFSINPQQYEEPSMIAIPIELQCQQVLFYIIEKMINFNLENQRPNTLVIDKEIKKYNQLKSNLQNEKDRMKDKEKELLNFFQGWFQFDKYIKEISKEEIGQQQDQIGLDLNFQINFDIETECLKIFKRYIFEKKKNELNTLKQLYEDKKTLNNLKNIYDQLKLNEIQLLVMLCAIQDQEKNIFARFYIKWWFDWNETSVFGKLKRQYQ